MSFSEIDLQLGSFKPIFPFLTGHTQTIIGHLMRPEIAPIPYMETILKLDDGDELFLEYHDNHSDHTISIYHGLAGDSNADYIRRSAELANELGWNLVLVNHRGANDRAKSARTYHSGRGEDASAVIRWARSKFKDSRQIALGFSMSGSILLNLLTGRYGTEKPDFAIVVNAPLNLKSAAEFLTKGLSRIYDYKFYLTLIELIQKRENISMPALGRTIDIDNMYTSKVNGFRDAVDYYEQCSAGAYVERINTKTFVLSAHDDPFIDVKDYLEAKWGPSVHVTLSKYGGHMGYVNKNIDPKYGRRWMDRYLGSVFDKIRML
jgi:predicted alpha/beta-fold hydrolase